MTKPLRIAFMGSPDFAVPTLAALLDAGHDVVCVYAQPPRPAVRGHKERPCPVHAFAAGRGLPVRTPVNFKDPTDRDAFKALDLDAAVVVAYGLILPTPVLDAPRLGCFNVHASLLPRWRGAAPIHRALLAGDVETGVTVMGMEAGLDTGPMYLTGRMPITNSTTASDLHDALAEIGAALMVEALTGIADGTLAATPQPAEGVTYAAKLSRDESRMDWTRPASEIERMVRGLNPWPGLWFDLEGERIKVLGAELASGSGVPGTVIAAPLVIACGDGALTVTRLQRPGKGPLDVADYLRGNPIAVGTVLE